MRRALVPILTVLLAGTSVAVLSTPADAVSTDHPTHTGRHIGRHRAPDLAVTGFALGGVPAKVVARNARGLSTLSVAGVTISADGRRVAAPDRLVARQPRLAHRKGLSAELLVSNYSDRLEDFDPAAAHALLSHPSRIRRVAKRMASLVRKGGWDGVNVDLERVRRVDAGGLVAFVRALQRSMPAERTVSIDISASWSISHYRSRGYALGGLARAADVIVVMAYDQHGPSWSHAGPVGDLRWQRSTVEAALKRIPARKLDLGVAGYGYSWPAHGTGGPLSPRAARRRCAAAGVTPRWHPASGEWSARLPNGTALWWADARSYAARVKLARSWGLHGLAVWRLGSADRLPRV